MRSCAPGRPASHRFPSNAAAGVRRQRARFHGSHAALRLEQVISTECDWPRNFSLDPSGRWLLVANQRSDSIVVFGRDPDNGSLIPTRQRIAIPSPVCLRFLAPSLQRSP